MFETFRRILVGNRPAAAARRRSTLDRDDASGRISELHRQATRHKDAGNLTLAIDCLEQAKRLRWKAATHFPVASWLRLPLLLQAAGRIDKAMAEFNALLDSARADAEQFHPQSSAEVHEMLTHARVAAIYDKMRLACKREKRTDEMEHYAACAARHHSEHKRLFEIDRARVSARLAERKQRREERRCRR